MKHINQNLKNLAFIGIVAFSLIFSACVSSTNPLTDESKHIYHPQNRDELVELLRDESIKLDTIDTSSVTDMSYLFANVPSGDCNYLETSGEIELYTKQCQNTAKYRKDFSGIETWDVSNVIDMRSMFREAKSFNQNSDSWKVNKEANTNNMFKDSLLESNPPKWYKK